MSVSSPPRADSLVSEIEADGSWVCGSCRSLNRRGAPRCYSCRLPSPLAAGASETGGSPLGWLAGFGVIALVLAMVVGLTLSGRLSMNPASTASASQLAYAPSSGQSASGSMTAANADASPGAETAEPSEWPTPSLTHAPTPTVTAEPTSSPTAPSHALPPPVDDVPRFPVSIPGASVKYYTISGSSGADLASAMMAKGPTVCGITDAAGCFRPTFRWTYQGGFSSKPSARVCSVTSVNFTATYTIYLPQWTGPSGAPAALTAWWKTVLDRIVWHENQHLAIAKSYVPKFKAAIMAGPCDQAGQDKATAAVETRLQAAQNAFDVQQGSLVLPPY
jgi:predicted secreted Zn-dependent protease